jgi:fructosamine-3-kinase
MEWLDFGYGGDSAWQRMGTNLAAMHRVTSSNGFGWRQNNTIGDTPQQNPWTSDWLEFYREHRLRYQFRLANRRGATFPVRMNCWPPYQNCWLTMIRPGPGAW